MGIKALLPCFESLYSHIHISAYRGHKVAIDAYGWLHRGGNDDNNDHDE